MSQKRYLGLELSGAKNAKTTLAVLEYYPREKKVFLLDVHTGIGADGTSSSDDVLIETVQDHADEHADLKMGVNVPLTLPPCLICNRKNCSALTCSSSTEVKWMKNFASKAALSSNRKLTTSKLKAKQKEFFTPYTQRPVELWLKHEVLCKLPDKIKFELDETLGSNKAPLAARMHYLKPYFEQYQLHEVLPKLTVALLMPYLKLKKKTIQEYRKLEEGVAARNTIIEKMSENLDIFIYDRDLKKITQNINAFDAFLCAYTVLLYDRNECVNPPRSFPVESGWIQYPKSPLLNSDADSSAAGVQGHDDSDDDDDDEEGDEDS